MFELIESYPGDPILTLLETFHRDTRAEKVNLGIGIYYDAQGKLPLLKTVRRAELALVADPLPRSYLPMEGLDRYRETNLELLFGERARALADRTASIQSLGGSGALKVGADLMRRYFKTSVVYISDPTWENHRSIFEGAGFEVREYPYYDPATHGLRFDAMLDCLSKLPRHTIVLVHPCCHNPTGVDMSRDQWRQVIAVVKERGLIPFADIAYQGFGEGLREDAWALGAMADAGFPFLVANSFSKNMGLYGERCGGLTMVCRDAEERERVFGQLKATVRRTYSSPPIFGGQLVARVLGERGLREEWESEVSGMRERIKAMRHALVEALRAEAPGRDFGFLERQRGMFSYSGLSTAQVDALRERYGVYLVRSGRMCLSGLTMDNLAHVASSIAAVVKMGS